MLRLAPLWPSKLLKRKFDARRCIDRRGEQRLVRKRAQRTGPPYQHRTSSSVRTLFAEISDSDFRFEGPRFDEEISVIQPDFYTKAGDYSIENLPSCEREALEGAGVEIRILPFSPRTFNHSHNRADEPLTHSESQLQVPEQFFEIGNISVAERLRPTFDNISTG